MERHTINKNHGEAEGKWKRLLDFLQVFNEGRWRGYLSWSDEKCDNAYGSLILQIPIASKHYFDGIIKEDSDLPALTKKVGDHIRGFPVSDPDISETFEELIEAINERLEKLEKK